MSSAGERCTRKIRIFAVNRQELNGHGAIRLAFKRILCCSQIGISSAKYVQSYQIESEADLKDPAEHSYFPTTYLPQGQPLLGLKQATGERHGTSSAIPIFVIAIYVPFGGGKLGVDCLQ